MGRLTAAALLVVMVALFAALPAGALELQGEHRLMARYADDLEVLAAEVLVLRHDPWWVELIVTQRWSRQWPARLEAEVSLWRARGGWDYGAGLLWREGQVQPWVMVARPW